jgi:hypothetical protein
VQSAGSGQFEFDARVLAQKGHGHVRKLDIELRTQFLQSGIEPIEGLAVRSEDVETRRALSTFLIDLKPLLSTQGSQQGVEHPILHGVHPFDAQRVSALFTRSIVWVRRACFERRVFGRSSVGHPTGLPWRRRRRNSPASSVQRDAALLSGVRFVHGFGRFRYTQGVYEFRMYAHHGVRQKLIEARMRMASDQALHHGV